MIGTAFQATDPVIAGRQHHPAVFRHCAVSPGHAEKHIRVAAPDSSMGLGKDLLNGIVSVAISVGITVYLAEDGEEMHPKLRDPETEEPLRFRSENEALRNEILYVQRSDKDGEFEVRSAPPRKAPNRDIAFEPAWKEYREGTIYEK